MLTIPLSWYVFFINPLMWNWQCTLSLFWLVNCFGWILSLYWKSLDRKIHKMSLLRVRVGKYVLIWVMISMGDRLTLGRPFCEFNLSTEDGEYFTFPAGDEEFLIEIGKLSYEAQL